MTGYVTGHPVNHGAMSDFVDPGSDSGDCVYVSVWSSVVVV